MSNLHEPMTSTASSITQSSTPSLHLQEPIGSSGNDSRSLNDLGEVEVQTNSDTDTNYGNGALVRQAAALVANVEEDKLHRQLGAGFAVTTQGGYEYRGPSQTSDETQTSLTLANDQHNQIRVMTVHANEQGQGSVSGLSGASFALSNAGTTQVVSQVQNVLSSTEVVDDNGQVPASVTVENNAEGTKYTYYPAVQNQDAASAAGQFYVMMSPQDMIPNVSGNNPQRIIAPRGHSIASMGDGTFTVETDSAIPVEFRKVETTGGRSSRDERRRATHNEVERRRRDKINTWIMKLAAIVPDCQDDQTKQGQSKGGILSKTLDFIGKLRSSNDRYADTLKDHERLIVENQVLRQQMEEVRRENALLRANLHMQQQEHTDVTGNGQSMETSH